jgi:DNA-binding NtrC family response regulator
MTKTTPFQIMLADDHVLLRNALGRFLETEDCFRVTDVLNDGQELIDKIKEGRIPDVVLLDMKMGRYSGDEVLAEIRKRWSKLCVIVVTGYPTMDNMRQTFKQDVFDYIAKPFSMDELRRSLQQAVTALGLGQRPQDRLRLELGRQVRLARTERSWTLKELSEASNVSVSQLSSIERGAHLPSLESLVAIAIALDRKPSVWMEGAGL